MEELTLERFEEASELVKDVTTETNWYTVSISLPRQETRYFSSRRTCSTRAPIR